MADGGGHSIAGVFTLETTHPRRVFVRIPRSNKKLMIMKTKKAPKHLKSETRQWWESVVESWALDEHHVRLLTLAAECWDRCAQAREILDSEGLTYFDFRGQPKARPEISIERDSRIGFARLLRELGLDIEEPAAESRLPRVGGK